MAGGHGERGRVVKYYDSLFSTGSMFESDIFYQETEKSAQNVGVIEIFSAKKFPFTILILLE